MALIFGKCCICIDLRLGCLIIGYLNLVGAITGIGDGITTLLYANKIDEEASSARRVEVEFLVKMLSGILMVAAYTILVFLVVLLVFTIVLLVGIHKHKRGCVLAHLIYSYVFLVLGLLAFLGSFSGPIEPWAVVEHLAILLVFIYFTLVIQSYHYKMGDDRRPQLLDPEIYNLESEMAMPR